MRARVYIQHEKKKKKRAEISTVRLRYFVNHTDRNRHYKKTNAVAMPCSCCVTSASRGNKVANPYPFFFFFLVL